MVHFTPMTTHLPCALLIVLTFIVGMWGGWQLRGTHSTLTPAVPDTSPRVTVVVPADYRALEPLTVDGKPALVGPRALLWYAAYSKAVEGFTCDGVTMLTRGEEYEAQQTAKAAVQQVYGTTLDT